MMAVNLKGGDPDNFKSKFMNFEVKIHEFCQKFMGKCAPSKILNTRLNSMLKVEVSINPPSDPQVMCTKVDILIPLSQGLLHSINVQSSLIP